MPSPPPERNLSNGRILLISGWALNALALVLALFGLVVTIRAYRDAVVDSGKREKEHQFVTQKLATIEQRLREADTHDQRSATSLLNRYLHEEGAKNNWEAVLKLSNLILAIDPHHQAALTFRGEYERVANSDCGSATSWYQEAVAVNSGNTFAADAYVHLGSCALKANDRVAALIFFEKALAIEPSYPDLSKTVDSLRTATTKK